VRRGAVVSDVSIDVMAARNPPMPDDTTVTATAPNRRNSTVWNAFTHAVPRMPPKKT
jgi:hypothetical protein